MAFALGDGLFGEAIRSVHAGHRRPILVGLCGAQGSGKSSTAARLRTRLRGEGLITVVCSLDDFYLTRSERRVLGREVHPLYATRGVPGTHDLALIDRTLDALLGAEPQDEVALPVFDKACDDRLEEGVWARHRGRVDVILIEGWCIGAVPESAAALVNPINALEREEDGDGRWRRTVNLALTKYQALFNRIDLRLMLRAPSFDIVFRWRLEQERALDRSRAKADLPMNEVELRRFLAHYERISCALLRDQPADLIADLDAARIPQQWRWTVAEAS